MGQSLDLEQQMCEKIMIITNFIIFNFIRMKTKITSVRPRLRIAIFRYVFVVSILFHYNYFYFSIAGFY